MNKKQEVTVDLCGAERSKIMASGIVEALVEHVPGYMSYTQVRAGLGLLFVAARPVPLLEFRREADVAL